MTDGDGSGRAGEFDLIARYFKPLATDVAARGLEDDAAVIDPPAGCSLVVTVDTITEGVHFLPATDPADVAAKALAVNLSDLAAMGAEPLGYTLALALGEAQDEAWVAAFAAGLSAGQQAYGISLLGGDTTSTPGPLSVTVTMTGTVPTGGAVSRGGARPGDAVCVTGSIGDGALGLRVAQGDGLGLSSYVAGFLKNRYLNPQPRLGLLAAARGVVTAAADISDGLVADAGHIAAASGVRIVLNADAVPRSDAARAALAGGAAALSDILAGGDDYELVIAVGRAGLAALQAAGADLGVAVTAVGSVEQGAGVAVVDGTGAAIALEHPGWRHR